MPTPRGPTPRETIACQHHARPVVVADPDGHVLTSSYDGAKITVHWASKKAGRASPFIVGTLKRTALAMTRLFC